MLVTMLSTHKGYPNGIDSETYVEGKQYDIQGELLDVFLKEGWAEPADPFPQGEGAGDAPQPLADPAGTAEQPTGEGPLTREQQASPENRAKPTGARKSPSSWWRRLTSWPAGIRGTSCSTLPKSKASKCPPA
jgi:hypothetical protein